MRTSMHWNVTTMFDPRAYMTRISAAAMLFDRMSMSETTLDLATRTPTVENTFGFTNAVELTPKAPVRGTKTTLNVVKSAISDPAAPTTAIASTAIAITTIAITAALMVADVQYRIWTTMSAWTCGALAWVALWISRRRGTTKLRGRVWKESRNSRRNCHFLLCVLCVTALALCASVQALTRPELSTLIDSCDGGNFGSCTAVEEADTSTITDMSSLFYLSSFNGEISRWDVSSVTTMRMMFRESSFNGDISKWNTGAVEDMSFMFSACDELWNCGSTAFNGDISLWNVSSVTTMYAMFRSSSFNGNISRWDVSSVTDMFGMFWLSSFNGDISRWDVSSVRTMRLMFAGTSFNGDISEWDVSSLGNMNGMFEKSPFNGDISDWDVSSVKLLGWTFFRSSFNGDISRWNVSSVEYMDVLFHLSSFNGDISRWDVSSVTTMVRMFWLSPFNGDISRWDVSSVTDMEFLLRSTPFNGDLCPWNLGTRSDINNRNGMFLESPLSDVPYGCRPSCQDSVQNNNEASADCGGDYNCAGGCVDECAGMLDNCNATAASCTDTHSSFACTCNIGYSGDGVTCTDVDECALGTDNCDIDYAACTNTDGSFGCSCAPGYAGDGVTCTVDDNECEEGCWGSNPGSTATAPGPQEVHGFESFSASFVEATLGPNTCNSSIGGCWVVTLAATPSTHISVNGESTSGVLSSSNDLGVGTVTGLVWTIGESELSTEGSYEETVMFTVDDANAGSGQIHSVNVRVTLVNSPFGAVSIQTKGLTNAELVTFVNAQVFEHHGTQPTSTHYMGLTFSARPEMSGQVRLVPPCNASTLSCAFPDGVNASLCQELVLAGGARGSVNLPVTFANPATLTLTFVTEDMDGNDVGVQEITVSVGTTNGVIEQCRPAEVAEVNLMSEVTFKLNTGLASASGSVPTWTVPRAPYDGRNVVNDDDIRAEYTSPAAITSESLITVGFFWDVAEVDVELKDLHVVWESGVAMNLSDGANWAIENGAFASPPSPREHGCGTEITAADQCVMFWRSVDPGSPASHRGISETADAAMIHSFLGITSGTNAAADAMVDDFVAAVVSDTQSCILIDPFAHGGQATTVHIHAVLEISPLVNFAASSSTAGGRRAQRVLLQSTVQSTDSSAADGLSSALVRFDVSAAAFAATVYNVPQEYVTSWTVEMELHESEACLPAEDLTEVCRLHMLAGLSGASSMILGVQVVSVTVDQASVQCDRRRGLRAVRDSVPATVEILIIFDDAEDAQPSIDVKQLESAPGIVSVHQTLPTSVAEGVHEAASPSVASPPAADPPAADPEDEDTSSAALIPVFAVISGCALVVAIGAVAWARRRGADSAPAMEVVHALAATVTSNDTQADDKQAATVASLHDRACTLEVVPSLNTALAFDDNDFPVGSISPATSAARSSPA